MTKCGSTLNFNSLLLRMGLDSPGVTQGHREKTKGGEGKN